MEGGRKILHWVHSPNICNSWHLLGQKRDLGSQFGSPTRVAGTKYSRHHLLPPRVCTGRKLESDAELGLQPRHYDMGCRCPKWHFNH